MLIKPIQEMSDMDIMEPDPTEYVSPLVVVQEKNNLKFD